MSDIGLWIVLVAIVSAICFVWDVSVLGTDRHIGERDLDCKSLGGYSVKTTYGVVCARLEVLKEKK